MDKERIIQLFKETLDSIEEVDKLQISYGSFCLVD